MLTHDAEFVCDKVGRSHHDGWESGIVSGLVDPQDVGLQQTREQVIESLGLAPNVEAASKVHGKGDEQFLEAIAALFKLKDQGIVRRVGISGYPLPVLLRLSRLVATTAPYRPLDAVLSYSNRCLHSDVLVGWKELFAADPRGDSTNALPELQWSAPLLMNGSPFSMGLLTDGTPPAWHPASDALKAATKEASRNLVAQGDSLTMTALTYGLRGSEVAHPSGAGPQLRTLVGLSHPDHVHSAVEAYRVLCSGATEAGDALSPPQTPPTTGEMRTPSRPRTRRQCAICLRSAACASGAGPAVCDRAPARVIVSIVFTGSNQGSSGRWHSCPCEECPERVDRVSVRIKC